MDRLSHATIEAGIAVLQFHKEVSNVFLNFNSAQLLALDKSAFFQKIQDIGILAKRLVFEVTESTYLEDPEVINIIKRLRKLGVRIALDDFGTGYSSLSCLNTLPLDFVKIDRSIVNKSFKDNQARTIIRVILALRQDFGFEVISEGIEHQKVLDFLKNEGVVFGQGYLLNEKPSFTSSLTGLNRVNTLNHAYQ